MPARTHAEAAWFLHVHLEFARQLAKDTSCQGRTATSLVGHAHETVKQRHLQKSMFWVTAVELIVSRLSRTAAELSSWLKCFFSAKCGCVRSKDSKHWLQCHWCQHCVTCAGVIRFASARTLVPGDWFLFGKPQQFGMQKCVRNSSLSDIHVSDHHDASSQRLLMCFINIHSIKLDRSWPLYEGITIAWNVPSATSYYTAGLWSLTSDREWLHKGRKYGVNVKKPFHAMKFTEVHAKWDQQ